MYRFPFLNVEYEIISWRKLVETVDLSVLLITKHKKKRSEDEGSC